MEADASQLAFFVMEGAVKQCLLKSPTLVEEIKLSITTLRNFHQETVNFANKSWIENHKKLMLCIITTAIGTHSLATSGVMDSWFEVLSCFRDGLYVLIAALLLKMNFLKISDLFVHYMRLTIIKHFCLKENICSEVNTFG